MSSTSKLSWTQILRVLWTTAASYGTMILIVVAWDMLNIRHSRSHPASKLRGSYIPQASSSSSSSSSPPLSEPLRQTLYHYFHPSRSSFGIIIELLAILFGLAQFILYLYNTYQPNFTTTSLVLSITFCSFFALRYLLRLFISEPGRRIRFVVSFDATIDLIVTIGALLPLFQYVGTFYTFTYLRMITVYYAWAALDTWLEPTLLFSRLQRHLIRMMLLVFAFLGAMGPTIAIVETAGDPDGWTSVVSPAEDFTLFNSLYFSVVTLSTVGYGDITPITFLGRLFTMIFIFVGIVLIGLLTTRLVDILGSQSAGHNTFVNPTRRLLVLLVGETSFGQLQDVLSELFHPLRFGARAHLHAIILVDSKNFKPEIRRYFHDHPVYAQLVTYLRGSVLSRSDLIRSCADTPEMQAIFVLQRRFAESDTANLLRVLSLRRHLPHVPLMVMLAHAHNRHIVEATGVHADSILSLDALRFGLLASNVITPGAAPLLINLFSMDEPSSITSSSSSSSSSSSLSSDARGGEKSKKNLGGKDKSSSSSWVQQPFFPSIFSVALVGRRRTESTHLVSENQSEMQQEQQQQSPRHGSRERLPFSSPPPVVLQSGAPLLPSRSGRSSTTPAHLNNALPFTTTTDTSDNNITDDHRHLVQQITFGHGEEVPEREEEVLESENEQQENDERIGTTKRVPSSDRQTPSPMPPPLDDSLLPAHERTTKQITSSSLSSDSSDSSPFPSSSSFPQPTDWEVEYGEGLGQEVFEVVVPQWLIGRTYSEACVLVYCSRYLLELHEEVEAKLKKQQLEKLIAARALARGERRSLPELSTHFFHWLTRRGRRRRERGSRSEIGIKDTILPQEEDELLSADSIKPKFKTINELLCHLQPRMDNDQQEGPVLIAVRHISKRTGETEIRCDLSTAAWPEGDARSQTQQSEHQHHHHSHHARSILPYRLKEGDSLVLISRDISVLLNEALGSGLVVAKEITFSSSSSLSSSTPMNRAAAAAAAAASREMIPTSNTTTTTHIPTSERKHDSDRIDEEDDEEDNGDDDNDEYTNNGIDAVPVRLSQGTSLSLLRPEEGPKTQQSPPTLTSSRREPISLSSMQSSASVSMRRIIKPMSATSQNISSNVPSPPHTKAAQRTSAPSIAPAIKQSTGYGSIRTPLFAASIFESLPPSIFPALPYAPPRSLRDHIVVITDARTKSLHLFIQPLRQVSMRPIVILSPTEPSAWIQTICSAYHQQQQQTRKGDENENENAAGSVRKKKRDDGENDTQQQQQQQQQQPQPQHQHQQRLDRSERGKGTDRNKHGFMSSSDIIAMTTTPSTTGHELAVSDLPIPAAAVAAASSTVIGPRRHATVTSPTTSIASSVSSGNGSIPLTNTPSSSVSSSPLSSPPSSSLSSSSSSSLMSKASSFFTNKMKRINTAPLGPVFFVRGNPLVEDELRAASVHTARRVVLFTGLPPEGAEDPASGGARGWSVMRAMDEAAAASGGGGGGGGGGGFVIPTKSAAAETTKGSGNFFFGAPAADMLLPEDPAQLGDALVDAVGVLSTMLIEGRLAPQSNLLVFGVTTEVALSRSVELLPPPETLRAMGVSRATEWIASSGKGGVSNNQWNDTVGRQERRTNKEQVAQGQRRRRSEPGAATTSRTNVPIPIPTPILTTTTTSSTGRNMESGQPSGQMQAVNNNKDGGTGEPHHRVRVGEQGHSTIRSNNNNGRGNHRLVRISALSTSALSVEDSPDQSSPSSSATTTSTNSSDEENINSQARSSVAQSGALSPLATAAVSRSFRHHHHPDPNPNQGEGGITNLTDVDAASAAPTTTTGGIRSEPQLIRPSYSLPPPAPPGTRDHHKQKDKGISSSSTPTLPHTTIHHQQQHTRKLSSIHSLRWSSRFAAGRIFPTSSLNSLLVSSFYNPSLLRLITMFSKGDRLRLRHVQVPLSLLHREGCVSRGVLQQQQQVGGSDRTGKPSASCSCTISYSSLFLHMVTEHRVVPLGLFRDRPWLNAPLPYVHANPSMRARVRCGDVVFVVVPV